MASQLVLVRHAKTQARQQGSDDLRRELTDAGARSAAATLPGLMRRLRREVIVDDAGEPLRDVSLWTSPAVRAMQTADAVAAGLDDVEPQVHDTLYADDPTGFLDELACADGCVVAVGHNPFLGDVLHLLTGQRVSFGKAAVAVLDLDLADVAPDAPLDGFANTGELRFFVQGPDWRRWQTLTELEGALAKAAQRIEDAAGKVVTASDDPESLHRYRVSLRVARSLVGFVSPWQRKAQGERLARLLKGLQAPTSAPREYDVLCGEVSTAGDGVQGGSPAAAATGFVGTCALERASARAAFLASFVSPKTQASLRRALKLMRAVRWREAVEGRGLAAGVVSRRFGELVEAYREDVALVDFEDAEATHTIRKRSKQLRYVSRELGDLVGADAADVMASAEADQSMLGKLCDARVNAALAREMLARQGGDDEVGAAYVRAQEETVEGLLDQLRGRRG